MKLSIIIVSWNVKEKLRKNLKALYQSKGDFNFEVFVVDNNSHDGTAEMVKTEFPQVKLIANKDNLGFGKANNQAMKEAKGEYVLFLNPDMRVFEDTLVNMLEWMEDNKQASVAGCKLVNERGEVVPHVRRFPNFWNQLAIVLKVPHLLPKVLDNYLQKDFDYNKDAKVDSIRGAFFIVRKSFFENKETKSPSTETTERDLVSKTVPYFDERYFIWFEEVDYCKQVYERGGEVWYTSAAKCVDYVGQSFSQVKLGRTQRYFRDSMLKYFRKWYGNLQYFLLWLAWWPFLVAAKMLSRFKK